MHYDVLISGAGPAGIMAANLLGKSGLSVAIFDREPAIFPLPRAAVIDDDIARIFQAADLEKELKEITSVSKGYQFFDQENTPMFGFVRDSQPSLHGYPTSFCIRQPEVEAIMRDGLKRYPNVHLFTSHEVLSLEQDDSSVELTVLSLKDDVTNTFTGAYLIASEGARSVIRKQLNISLENLEFDHPWLIVDFEADEDLQLEKRNLQYCQPDRPITYLYLGRNLYRYEIMLKADEDIESLTKEENVLQLLDTIIDTSKIKIERFVTYTFHALIAKEWRKERVFLVGDTAHQMPPFLGQGLSSGIRDAANIAWKLAYVLKNNAADSLLETYHSERHPHVYKIMQQAIRLGGIIQAPTKELADFRDSIFSYLNSIPNIHQAMHHIERSKNPIGTGLHHLSLAVSDQVAHPQFTVDGQALDYLTKREFTLLIHPSLQLEKIKKAYPDFQILQLPNELEVIAWFELNNATIVISRPDSYVYSFGNEDDISNILCDLYKIIPHKKGVNL